MYTYIYIYIYIYIYTNIKIYKYIEIHEENIYLKFIKEYIKNRKYKLCKMFKKCI